MTRVFTASKYLVVLGLTVAVVAGLVTGDLMRTYHGLENWEERRTGGWVWYDHAFEWFGITFAAVGGWVVGRLWTVRKYSDLPKWAKRILKNRGVKEFDFEDEELELPSRKELVFFGVGMVGIIVWSIVSKAIG